MQQLFGNTKALLIAGGFLLLLMVTSLPTIPMAALGAGCIGLAIVLKQQRNRVEQENDAREQAARAAKPTPHPKPVEDFLSVDPMEVAIGVGLVGLAAPSRGGDLMQRISDMRNALAADIGVILPKVRVRDDASLSHNAYEIRLAGDAILQAELQPDRLLAIDDGDTTGTIDGIPATDLLPGQTGRWIDPANLEQAAIYGYVIQTPVEVLTNHLREISTFHADELLSRDATQHLIDQLRETAPVLVDDLIPKTMRISEVQQVLQQLLREGVPIRQLRQILEILGDVASRTDDTAILCEHVRQGLSRTISARYRDSHDVIHVVTLDPLLELEIADSIEKTDSGLLTKFAPEASEFTCKRIKEAVKNLVASGHPPVVLVRPRIRLALRQITAISMPWLKVLSLEEITHDTQVQSHAVISLAPTEMASNDPRAPIQEIDTNPTQQHAAA